MSLNINQTINKLKSYADSPVPILSVYLDIPKNKSGDISQLVNNFDELISLSLTEEQLKEFSKNIEYMRGYVKEYASNHIGLVMFSGGDTLWEVIPVEEHITNSVAISHSPNLVPLLDILHKQQRYLVILVDQEKALFFTLIDNELEEKGSLQDVSVHKKVKGGYGGEFSDKVTHRFQEELKKHMELIAQNIDTFVDNKPIIGVIIGGHKTTMHYLKHYLPQRLNQKILGYFISELNIPFETILSQSKQFLSDIHLRELQRYTA